MIGGLLPESAKVDAAVLHRSLDVAVTVVVGVETALPATFEVGVTVLVLKAADAVVVLFVGNFFRMSSLAFQPS